MQRIYLDNAATSWPKPESVYQAVDSYQRNLGAPAGRGVYEAAREVDRRLERARWLLSQLIDASDWRQIVFTYSGTDALTLALQGTLRPGDHVITSVYEHSSVLRPLRYWESQGKIHVTRISGDSSGQIHADQIKTALTDKTRLVALTHASNVTGTLQPLAEIGQLLASHPALFLVDAAQTVGHLPVSVRQLQCDFLAAPAHKGLLAPTGTGFLYIAPDRQSCLEPARLGGTGTFSESDEQPTEMPGRYEAGNHNVPGLLGLEAALQFLQQHAVDQVAHHGQLLGQQVYQGLASMAHVVVYGPDRSQPTAPLLSFNLKNLAPQEAVILLNEIAGIEARAGFHCAPRMHATLQTSELGGTVRVSWGVFSKSSDIEALLEAVESLAG